MQFLTFSLTPENQAMLPTAQVAEVLNLDPSQIVPIPDMPAGVMGVCNWRGQVLWLVDLAYILGLGAIFAQDLHYAKHPVLIIRHNNKFLGLAVNKIGNLMACDTSKIQPTPTIAMPQMQVLYLCLKGQIIDGEGKDMLILDGNVIIDFLGKHRHQKEQDLPSSPREVSNLKSEI